MRGRNQLADLAIVGVDLPRRFPGIRNEAQARNGRDAGQCFATKPKRHHGLKVVKTADLAGCVTRQRERHLIPRYSATVVTITKQLLPACLDIDADAGSACVETVGSIVLLTGSLIVNVVLFWDFLVLY